MLIIGCYPSWAIYKDFKISDIPPGTISHLTYCFAIIRDGLLVLGDPWADLRVQTQWPDANVAFEGNFRELINFKRQNEKVKIGIAIGGWGCKFAPAVNSEKSRMAFVGRIEQLTNRFGFEYIDIDWEYPEDPDEYKNLLSVVQLIKSRVQCDVFLSLPCNVSKLEEYMLSGLAKYVSYFNLMGYDLSGQWSDKSAYSSNLFASKSAPLCVDDAVQFLLKHGIQADKIILGIPFYGKCFDNCQELGGTFEGVSDIDYRCIKKDDTHFDSQLSASYSKASGSLTVFNCKKCIVSKIEYIKKLGLAGIMCWDLSKDSENADLSLLAIMNAVK